MKQFYHIAMSAIYGANLGEIINMKSLLLGDELLTMAVGMLRYI